MKKLVVAAAFAAALVIPASPASAYPVPPRMNPCVFALRTVMGRHFGAAVAERFVAISWRESRWLEHVQNKRSMGRRWGAATGCTQVLPGVARNVGAHCDLHHAWCSAYATRLLYARMGWSPWAVR